MIRLTDQPVHFYADEADKPALLLVHGYLSSRNHWKLNEAALRSRYRLVLAELPGHGLTPGCGPELLGPDALADCFEGARERLGIGRWHVCGQSFGAALTLRYAIRHPASVKAVVWTNANRALSWQLTDEEMADQLARADRLEFQGVEALRREKFHPRFARRFPDEMRTLLSHDADNGDMLCYANLIRKVTTRMTVRDLFPTLQPPVLLINGLLERGFQPTRDLAASLLPTMEIVDLEGGHSVNIEQPEGFDRAALAFLARHDA